MAKKKTAKSASVNESWQRVELWLREHARPLERSLAGGVSQDQLRKLEATLHVTLPQAFKDSLTIHDGQKGDNDLIPDDGIGSFFLLPSKHILRDWKEWNAVQAVGDFDKAAPEKGITKAWWNPGWIPFASNGGGDHLCLDLSPAKGGIVGQVIRVRHDDAARTLMATSFGAWLQALADTIEKGGIDYLIQ